MIGTGYTLSTEEFGPNELVSQAARAEAAGYDHVYTHQIGDDQQALIDLYEEEILPSFD